MLRASKWKIMNKTELSKTDRIIAEIGQQIISGKYVPGSSLPSEAEMCEEFQPRATLFAKCCERLRRNGWLR